MPSSYTTSLRLTLPATGELSGQWGNTVNTGITELLDAAVAGTAAISTWGGAGVSYTLSNNSGTSDEARRMFIVATGSPGEAKNVICPAVSKFYVFRNDTTGGFALTLKTPSGTGIAVPAGQYKFLYCNGTDVVEAFNSAGALTLSGALSVGGTATFAANPTLSAGTANQVQFLNASKVLVGSANMTFNGTDLTVSGAVNAGSVNATTLDLTNLEVTNIKAKDGTASMTLADATGVATFSANPTLSAGTAQGVLYLNGSKVATSGSALTFDGTTLGSAGGAKVTGPAASLAIDGGTFDYLATITRLAAGRAGGNYGEFQLYVAGASGVTKRFSAAYDSTFNWYDPAGTGQYMTLTSTGLSLASTSDLTLNKGTANGVLYLNGSKVATSGSALTFDGTNLSLISGGYFNLSGDTFINNGKASFYYEPGTTTWINIKSPSVGALSWNNSGGELMRLTSTGLGIGTSSPATKLDVSGTSPTISVTPAAQNQATGINLKVLNAGTYGAARIEATNNTTYDSNLLFYTNTSTSNTLVERMRLDSSGNLGLGVTPSAWQSIYRAAQFPAGVSVAGRNDGGIEGIFATNAFRNSAGTWTYTNTGVARRYVQEADGHLWYTAPSGTAGNAISFTQAMTLDASGNLGVGVTSPAYKIDVAGSIRINDRGTSFALRYPDWNVYNTSTGNALAFDNGTERARITSGGYFKASNGGTYQNSTGPFHELYKSENNADWAAVVTHAGATTGNQYGLKVDLTGDPNGTSNEFLYCEGASTLRASIRSNGGLANYSANDVNLSDRREKTNFAPAKSYLDTICAIPVQTFNYIDQSEDDPGLTLGVVAQDVQAVAPELVMESNWGTADDPKMRLSIYQTDLQYALMKALQELKAEFDAYKATHP